MELELAVRLGPPMVPARLLARLVRLPFLCRLRRLGQHRGRVERALLLEGLLQEEP